MIEDTQTSLVLSPFVLAELDYLLATRIGHDAEVAVLEEVERGAYHLESFSAEDVRDSRHLIELYKDLGIGLADASNVVLAHRYDTLDILTLDQRHFRTLKSSRDQPFRLLPLDR